MSKILRTISATLSMLCLFLVIVGIDTDIRYGLFAIPFVVLMYISGGCYSVFYPYRGRRYKR